MREHGGGGEFDELHCMHMWKYHSETPLYNKYFLVKSEK
jgi:hypothetical protein